MKKECATDEDLAKPFPQAENSCRIGLLHHNAVTTFRVILCHRGDRDALRESASIPVRPATLGRTRVRPIRQGSAMGAKLLLLAVREHAVGPAVRNLPPGMGDAPMKMIRFLVSAAFLLAVLSDPSSVGRADGALAQGKQVQIQGAGATFPAPLYAKWVTEYNAGRKEVRVDYQPIGSGGGIKGITDRTIDFGGSDAPLTDEQVRAAPGTLLHIPTVAGPVVLAYNLEGVKDLTLDGGSLAAIYLGEIRKWNDRRLQAINPGVSLPDQDIIVAHRSDGSGTTWIFSNYLSKVSTAWMRRVGNATSIKWPVGIGGKGNPGVAQVVKNSAGGIGYMELAYAESAGLRYARQINRAGKPVQASIQGVVDAASLSDSAIPNDMRLSITDAPGDNSYPICGFTYLLLYEDLSYLKDSAKARELVRFVHWCCHEGQDMAKDLHYARLPSGIQAKADEILAGVTFDGKPVLGK
jgi:phosphate transport system substrate-binding protein